MNYYTRQRLLRKLAKSSYEDVQNKYVGIGEEAPSIAYATLASGGTVPVLQALLGGPTFGGLAAQIGGDVPTKEELKDLKSWDPISFIPLAASYRAGKRDMYVDNKLSKGKSVRKHRVAEQWGPAVNAALLGLLGGALGLGGAKLAGLDNREALAMALAGVGVGGGASGLASLIGRISGLAGGAKDDKEHTEYLNNSVLGHYLLPGVGAYHGGRRVRTTGNIFA